MLRDQLIQYLAHKLQLAKVSKHYQQPVIRQSVNWAHGVLVYVKRHRNELNDQSVKMLISGQSHHLKNLLPYEGNASYKSSAETLASILASLKPKPTNNYQYEW